MNLIKKTFVLADAFTINLIVNVDIQISNNDVRLGSEELTRC